MHETLSEWYVSQEISIVVDGKFLYIHSSLHIHCIFTEHSLLPERGGSLDFSLTTALQWGNQWSATCADYLECNLADLLLATITFGALSASFFSPELNLDPHVCSQGAVSRVFHCPHCSVFSHTTVHKFPHTSTNCPIPQPELLRKENLFYGDVCATKMQGIISENESHSWQKVCFILARTWLCVIFMGWQSLDTSPPHIILDLAKPAPPCQANNIF